MSGHRRRPRSSGTRRTVVLVQVLLVFTAVHGRSVHPSDHGASILRLDHVLPVNKRDTSPHHLGDRGVPVERTRIRDTGTTRRSRVDKSPSDRPFQRNDTSAFTTHARR